MPEEARGRHASSELDGASPKVRIGSVIADRYRLLHRVDAPEPRFKAVDQRLGREVTVCFPNLDVDTADLIRGEAGHRPASDLRHPSLEPLFDVGYDLAAESTFLVTSYAPSIVLIEHPAPAELAIGALAELSALLELLAAERLGCAALRPERLRVVVDADPAARLRVPLISLYVWHEERSLAQDLADLGRLALWLWQSADRRTRPERGLRRLVNGLVRDPLDASGAAAALNRLRALLPAPDHDLAAS